MESQNLYTSFELNLPSKYHYFISSNQWFYNSEIQTVKKLPTVNPRKKAVSADSPVSCCRLCVRDDTCYSVNYKNKSLLCELVVGTSLPDGNFVSTDNWDLYTSDGNTLTHGRLKTHVLL